MAKRSFGRTPGGRTKRKGPETPEPDVSGIFGNKTGRVRGGIRGAGNSGPRKGAGKG